MTVHMKLSLLLGIAFLSGCSLAPDYIQPKTVADRAVLLKAGELEQKYHFRDLFHADPELSHVLEQALINNYDYLQGIERVRAARAQKHYSLFELLPGVNYSITKDTRMTRSTSLFTGESVRLKSKGYQNSLGVDSYELDIWGKKISEIDAHDKELQATKSDVAALQLTLMSDVANAWYEALSMIRIWHELNEKQRITTQIQSRLEKLDRQDRLDPVMMSKFLRSKSSDDSQRESLTREINNRIHQIEFLSGYRSPWLNRDSWQQLSGDYAVPDVPQQITSEVIFNRPDVISAEMNIRAANGTIGAARAAFLPLFNLYASTWQTSETFRQVQWNLGDNWALTPSLILPIFNWPKNYASLNYAESQQAIAVLEYRKTVAQALKEIQDTTNNLSLYAETLKILETEVRHQRENFQRVMRRYEAGYSDLYSLYEALDVKATAQMELESSRQQMMSNVIALLSFIGG